MGIVNTKFSIHSLAGAVMLGLSNISKCQTHMHSRRHIVVVKRLLPSQSQSSYCTLCIRNSYRIEKSNPQIRTILLQRILSFEHHTHARTVHTHTHSLRLSLLRLVGGRREWRKVMPQRKFHASSARRRQRPRRQGM